jgi:hypothetical protein
MAFLSSLLLYSPLLISLAFSLSLSLTYRRPCCYAWGIVSHKLSIYTDAKKIEGRRKKDPNDDPLHLITAP